MQLVAIAEVQSNDGEGDLYLTAISQGMTRIGILTALTLFMQGPPLSSSKWRDSQGRLPVCYTNQELY